MFRCRCTKAAPRTGRYRSQHMRLRLLVLISALLCGTVLAASAGAAPAATADASFALKPVMYDPALTARDADGMPLPHQPLPVVMGMSDLPDGAKLQHTALHLRKLRDCESSEAHPS